MNARHPDLRTRLLAFWFGEDDRPQLRRWFRGSHEVSALIAQDFGEAHASAVAGELDAWRETPEGAAALLVLLDGLTPHLREGADVFVSQPAALTVARALLATEVPPAWRAMALLALVRSEHLPTAREGAAGLDALWRDPVTRAGRKTYKRLRHHAHKRLQVLERYQRYPDRNAALGRTDTADEVRYLAGRAKPRNRPHLGEDRLKIVVLHGMRQSAARLSAGTSALQRAVGDIAELVFVDAPHAYVEDGLAETHAETDRRCWWNADGTSYRGWEASVRAVEAAMEGADGLLGFSQGASLAGLVAAAHADALHFAICISGFPSRAPEHRILTAAGSIDLPSLHVFGEADTHVAPDRTRALAGCFRDAEIRAHAGGHFTPQHWPLEDIRRFLLRFVEAPPISRVQLDDPAWRDAVRANEDAPADLPALDALPLPEPPFHELLAEAVGLRHPVVYGNAEDVRDPIRGDLAHRIWLAVWRQDPDAVLHALTRDEDWSALTRLAVVGSALLDTPGPLVDAVAARFARQIRRDEASGVATEVGARAPRIRSAANRASGLGLTIARQLSPELDDGDARRAYRARLGVLTRKLQASRLPRPRREPTAGVSCEVRDPRPMPVVPAPLAELRPLFDHLASKTPVSEQSEFTRGILFPDGRLDLCKQVVGPAGIQPLLTSLADHTEVKRLLLGNNVIGPSGADAVAAFVASPQCHLEVLYLAGNEFDAAAVTRVCEAVAHNPCIQGLWLKRNPLGPDGAVPVAELLRVHSRLDTLDMVNTGLLDAGARTLLAAVADNEALEHLYLGTNGLGPDIAARLGRYLAEHDRLESLYVSCNRFGDAGIAALAEGLAASTSLRRLSLASTRLGPAGARALRDALRVNTTLQFLDLGWTRATVAVGEDGNHLGDEGAAVIAEILSENTSLRGLDVSHNQISRDGIATIGEALTHNTTLLHLRRPQYGQRTDATVSARLEGCLTRNRREMGVDDSVVDRIRQPSTARDVLSVYRTRG
jgi:uncharacterized protein (DUF924 family)/Ran GTPase-activating protein (RanGAP) involved in mRNA processing and transport/predicted esterase